MSEKLQVDWDCGSNGMFIHAPGLGSGVRVTRNKPGALLQWNNVKSGFVDNGGFNLPPYKYSAPGFESSDDSKKRPNCPHTAGNFLNHSFLPSSSEAPEDDQSTSQGEYQLVVPRYAVINEYIHDDETILDGRWRHENILPLSDGDTRGQAIGAWLFQSSPRIFNVIARERSSQGGRDFLVGYEIILDRTLEEREEGVVGETAKEGYAEVIVEEVEVKKEVEVERDAEAVIEVEESIESRPDRRKHKRVWVGPVPLVTDTDRPIDGVTGSAAFLLTNFDEENLFHLLVPSGASIEYFTNNSGSILGKWTHVATLQPPSDVPETQITAVTFVQSSQGKFEAVARVTQPNERYSYLVGYELDAVNHQREWSSPFRLVADTVPIDKVTGSPTIIESDFGEEDRFHLLVPQDALTVQYTLAVGSFSGEQWKSFATLNPFQNLPVKAVSLVENQVGGFEAVIRVQGPQGDELVIGYELRSGMTQWSDGVALNADDGPILAGKPTPPE